MFGASLVALAVALAPFANAAAPEWGQVRRYFYIGSSLLFNMTRSVVVSTGLVTLVSPRIHE